MTKKLVDQTYDGASVMKDHVTCLQTKALLSYPHALFTHCYAYSINLVLQQSLAIIKECKSFFKTLNGLSTFLLNHPKEYMPFMNLCRRNYQQGGISSQGACRERIQILAVQVLREYLDDAEHLG
jgi:hypothetical protein